MLSHKAWLPTRRRRPNIHHSPKLSPSGLPSATTPSSRRPTPPHHTYRCRPSLGYNLQVGNVLPSSAAKFNHVLSTMAAPRCDKTLYVFRTKGRAAFLPRFAPVSVDPPPLCSENAPPFSVGWSDQVREFRMNHISTPFGSSKSCRRSAARPISCLEIWTYVD